MRIDHAFAPKGIIEQQGAANGQKGKTEVEVGFVVVFIGIDKNNVWTEVERWYNV